MKDILLVISGWYFGIATVFGLMSELMDMTILLILGILTLFVYDSFKSRGTITRLIELIEDGKNPESLINNILDEISKERNSILTDNTKDEDESYLAGLDYATQIIWEEFKKFKKCI